MVVRQPQLLITHVYYQNCLFESDFLGNPESLVSTRESCYNRPLRRAGTWGAAQIPGE